MALAEASRRKASLLVSQNAPERQSRYGASIVAPQLIPTRGRPQPPIGAGCDAA
jgi:hypothetical protein